MTLVSSIITDAYRETNLIPEGATPNANQVATGLARLNSLLMSTIGYEAGTNLTDFVIGGTYDQTSEFNNVPRDARLVLNLAGATTLNLHPYPIEGQRLAVVDVAGNLATFHLTLAGNEHNIEGSSTLVLSTNGMTREWIYHADAGNWVKITDLVSADTFPFPEAFDDFFIITLAMRLNPNYGQSLSPESSASLARSRNQLRARYGRPMGVVPDVASTVWRANRVYGWAYRDENFDTGKAL